MQTGSGLDSLYMTNEMAAPMEGIPCPGKSLCRLSGFSLTCHSLTNTLFLPGSLLTSLGGAIRNPKKT